MVQWMVTRYLSGFSNFQMAERDISANACQGTCGVSRTWPGQWIKRGASSGTRHKWKCTPQCTSCTKGCVILSSSGPSVLVEVVANEVFCESCGYIQHVCRNWKWWTHRNAAQISWFVKSLCIHCDTQSWRYQPKSYSGKPCSNHSELLGIEWAAAGICTSCPVRENQVLHTWWRNMGPGGYDNHASDLH